MSLLLACVTTPLQVISTSGFLCPYYHLKHLSSQIWVLVSSHSNWSRNQTTTIWQYMMQSFEEKKSSPLHKCKMYKSIWYYYLSIHTCVHVHTQMLLYARTTSRGGDKNQVQWLPQWKGIRLLGGELGRCKRLIFHCIPFLSFEFCTMCIFWTLKRLIFKINFN